MAVSRRLSNKIIARYEKYRSMPRVASELDISMNQVLQVLKEANIPRNGSAYNRSNGKLSEKDVEKLICLYEGGTSVSDLSGEFGITRQAVYKVLDRNRITRRKPNPIEKDKELGDKIVELFMRSARTSQVAKELDISRERVRKVLRERGVTRQDAIESIDKDVMTAFNNGESVEDLAGKYSVSVLTLKQKLWSRGVSLVNTKTLSDEEKQVACSRYQEGESVNRITRDCGTTRYRIRKSLSDNGISLRTARNKITLEGKVEVVRLISSGCTYENTAESFEVSTATICRILRKYSKY